MSSTGRAASSSRKHSSIVRRIRYRIDQFLRGLSAGVSDEERAAVAKILPPRAVDLFVRMPVDAQRHSLNVLYSVRSADGCDPDLEAAALLHDVGKLAAGEGGARLGLWMRGPLVLVEAWSPRVLARLASSDPSSGLRYTAYVHLEHPSIGADWAASAGCSERTCWLIRHHQDDVVLLPAVTEGEELPHLLSILQEADGRS